MQVRWDSPNKILIIIYPDLNCRLFLSKSEWREDTFFLNYNPGIFLATKTHTRKEILSAHPELDLYLKLFFS